MRSSESTRNRRAEGAVPLLILLSREDHPKACTGLRLLRAGLVRSVGPGRPPAPLPLLLDPHAERPLAPSDAARARTAGVLVIDCSWNRLAERGGYPREAPWLGRLPERRRLPWLLAANPQHFGRLGELNTAEALAASLAVLGDRRAAEDLLDRFHGGDAFFRMNEALLTGLRPGDGPSEVVALEQRVYAPDPRAADARRGRRELAPASQSTGG